MLEPPRLPVLRQAGGRAGGGCVGVAGGAGRATGKPVYDTRCAQCHQANGQGIPGSFPPLTQTEWVLGDKGRLVRLLLNGMQGPLEAEGEAYNGIMILPPPALTNEQIAAVLTYVRQHFGNDAEAVTPDEVASVRVANEREGLWDAAELLERTGLPGE